MAKKLTKKQIERRKRRRALKAAREWHHELNKQQRDARRPVIRGADKGPVPLPKPKASTRARHRRTGAGQRVGR